MRYQLWALFSVTIFALVHFFAQNSHQLKGNWQARLLSIGGGIAIAYVFIDLLPKLARSDQLVTKAFQGLFPYFEKHVYLLALVGFLLFFTVARSGQVMSQQSSFCLSISSYGLFNFLVGYAVADSHNPEVQPLALFTLAIGLHYFAIDYSLTGTYPGFYRSEGKWFLVSLLFLGYLAGLVFVLSPTAIALVSAFIGGGVILNVTRHELSETSPNDLGSFLFGAFFYTLILLL